MKNILEYRGYYTKIEFDADSKVLRGKIEGINDYVDFGRVFIGGDSAEGNIAHNLTIL